MRDLLKIDGTNLPGLTSFTATPNDLDSEESGRSPGSGIMHRERIRKDVYDLAYRCLMIDDATLVSLRTLIAPVEVPVSFWIGETITCNMYASAPTVELVCVDQYGNCSWNVSGNLIRI